MNANNNDVQLRPALIIGLGGTGKQVLLNLRRMFYDQFGEPTLPHVATLWIDTDVSNRTADGAEMDFLLKEVEFDSREKQSVQLQANELENYYEHEESFPHIFSWFDASLKKHGLITDGAGQIRSFGRLAFFRHYEDIMAKVRHCIESMRQASDHSELIDRYGIRLDRKNTDVWIVLSLAGGTGSGMFLDMAFALKHLNKTLRIRGMLVLPSVFSNDVENAIYGNSYAALMELEHYTYAKQTAGEASMREAARFPAAWTRAQFDKGDSVQGPPFDTAYLIGNEPRSSSGSLALGDKGALSDMLAEVLFVEYSGTVESLASSWRSARSNMSSALTSVVRYPQSARGQTIIDEFSCRYASLGLAKLHVPINRIATIVRHRLAADLVRYWTAEADLPTNLQEQVEKEFHASLRLPVRGGSAGSAPSFVTFLAGGTSQQPQLVDLIRDQVQQRRGGFLNKSGSGRVGEELLGWMRDDLLAAQLDCTHVVRERWGTIARLLHLQHTEVLEEEVKRAIDDMLVAVLSAPDRGFAFAREALRRVADRLGEQQVNFRRRAEVLRQKAKGTNREIQERLGWLNDVGGAFTRRTIVAVALDMIEERVVEEVRAQVFEAAAEVSKRLADHIGSGSKTQDAEGKEVTVETGLMKQLSELQAILAQEVGTQIDARLKALRRLPSSPINVTLYDEDGDRANFYVTDQGKPFDREVLAEYSRRFFEEAPNRAATDLWRLRQSLRDRGTRQFLERVLFFTRQMTPHVNQRTADVIERMGRRHQQSEQSYAAAISALVGFGHPWLSQPAHFTNRDVSMKNVKLEFWCAMQPRMGSDAHEKFQETVRAIADVPPQVVDSPPDKVYMSSEMAGFPLTVVPGLAEYRDRSYLPRLQNNEVLHTDYRYEKFQDLLVREPAELEAYLRALEVVAQAILVGSLRGEMSQEQGRRTGISSFHFLERKMGMRAQRRDLGPFALAVRRLMLEREQPLRNAIETDVKSRIDQFDVTDYIRWYALLTSTADENPVGNPAFAMLLATLAQRIADRYPHVVEDADFQRNRMETWSIENPAGSGFRCLVKEV
ncbi:MAG: tubulin-like doman-containing protein [Alphaproteobacteria bacterium]